MEWRNIAEWGRWGLHELRRFRTIKINVVIVSLEFLVFFMFCLFFSSLFNGGCAGDVMWGFGFRYLRNYSVFKTVKHTYKQAAVERNMWTLRYCKGFCRPVVLTWSYLQILTCNAALNITHKLSTFSHYISFFLLILLLLMLTTRLSFLPTFSFALPSVLYVIFITPLHYLVKIISLL